MGEYVLTHGTVAYDDQSGTQLGPELAMEARRDEVQYFRDMRVYDKVPMEDAWQAIGKAPVAARSVDINKGDEKEPRYRSRFVAKEYKTDARPDLYAATPPSACLRLLVSRMASKPGATIMHADVS